MFLVIEVQKTSDSQVAPILTSWATEAQAQNKYHTILSAAALSQVPVHSAAILNDMGCILRNQSYVHDVE